MYLALAIHLTGFSAALVTGKRLYGYRLFPIIKWLLGTLTCTAALSYGVSIIGSVLMLNLGQSLSTCTLFVYNMSVAHLTTHSLVTCLAINRFYISKKKVPNVRKMLCWNTLTIIATFLIGHIPIVLSGLGKPIPFVAQCARFEDDQLDNWYGLVAASILFISSMVTVAYTFKLKRIMKKSVKNRYSHQITDNMMKIGNVLCTLFVKVTYSYNLHMFHIHSLSMCCLWQLLRGLRPRGLQLQVNFLF